MPASTALHSLKRWLQRVRATQMCQHLAIRGWRSGGQGPADPGRITRSLNGSGSTCDPDRFRGKQPGRGLAQESAVDHAEPRRRRRSRADSLGNEASRSVTCLLDTNVISQARNGIYDPPWSGSSRKLSPLIGRSTRKCRRSRVRILYVSYRWARTTSDASVNPICWSR